MPRPRMAKTLLMARTVSRCAAVTRLRLDFTEARFNLRGREAAPGEITLGPVRRGEMTPPSLSSANPPENRSRRDPGQ